MIIGSCLTISARLHNKVIGVDLGRLQTGATVSFVRTAGGEWGIEISGGVAPLVRQKKPAQIEVFRS